MATSSSSRTCLHGVEAESEAARAAAKRWIDVTMSTRLKDKRTGGIFSIQQRLHEDDPTAYLLEKGFAHLNLPAIAVKDENRAR